MTPFVNRPNTAPRVVDVHNGVVGRTNDGNDVVVNIAMVDKARAADVDVVWVQHNRDGLRRDGGSCQHAPELARRDFEPLVQKTYGNSFEETGWVSDNCPQSPRLIWPRPGVDVLGCRHDGSFDEGWMGDGGWPRWRRVALGACLVMLVGGCTFSRSSEEPGGTLSSASATAGVSELPSMAGNDNEVSCAASIASRSDPPDHYRVIAPGVAVPAAPVLQANDTGEADATKRLFAKWGLVVRTGTVVDLQVGPGWEDRARIQWGNSASPGVAVHVPACPPLSGQTQWLAFAGGTWVAQPACVPLVVRSQGQEVQVRLGVGMPCVDASGP